jgi:hypothetical protein
LTSGMQVYTKTLDEELRYSLWNLYFLLSLLLNPHLFYPSSSPPNSSPSSVLTFHGFYYVFMWNCVFCCCIFVKDCCFYAIKSCFVLRLVECIVCAVTGCMYVNRNCKLGDIISPSFLGPNRNYIPEQEICYQII